MDIASPNTEELTTARWFVMRAYKSEKRAEEKLKGKDGLEYFIPKYYAVRVYHGVKSKRLVPVIPNLVFVHASRIQITEFKKRYNFLQFVMWEKSTGLEYLVVPDDQMESFIRVSSQYEENISYYNPDELDLRKGRRVRIHGGKLNGVMGAGQKKPPGRRPAGRCHGRSRRGASRLDRGYLLTVVYPLSKADTIELENYERQTECRATLDVAETSDRNPYGRDTLQRTGQQKVYPLIRRRRILARLRRVGLSVKPDIHGM